MVFHLFPTLWGGYNSGKKRDLSIICTDLPTVLQTSPRTKGMPKNLSSLVSTMHHFPLCTEISYQRCLTVKIQAGPNFIRLKVDKSLIKLVI